MNKQSSTLGSLLLLVSLLVVTNAHATCTGSGLTGDFRGYTYIHSPGTNMPSSMLGAFWAFGFGSPAPGAGADNGGWQLDEPTPSASAGWLLAYQALDTNYLMGSWGASQEIDSCILGHVAPGKSREIMVAALFDVRGSGESSAGLLGVMATQRRELGNPDFDFTYAATPQFELVPLPHPFVLSSSRGPSGIVTVGLRAPTLAQASPAVVTDGSVSAAELVTGYRAYMQSFSANDFPPADRRIESGWLLVAGTTPLGQDIEVVLANLCDRAVLAYSLVLASGFETPFVSGNSVRIDTRTCNPANDFDGDGYNPNACCPLPDCDDSNAAVHPGATEVCNGIDDDCDGIVDGTGADADADGVQDLCDDCASTPDPGQSDFDGDGQGDACDLDDGLILVLFPSRSQVAWQPESGFTTWNLYRGDLGVLASTGEYTQQAGSNPLARRDCGLASTLAPDTLDPATGQVAFSLVTGQDAMGEGSLGSDGAGNERPNAHPCP